MDTLKLRVHIHSPKYEIPPNEVEKLNTSLLPLEEATTSFPMADLHLNVVFHGRDNTFHVKAALNLPKQSLFTGERNGLFHHACERCIRKLVHKVNAYKNQMTGRPEIEKIAQHTHHEVYPASEPDIRALENAAADQNYTDFRQAISVYDGALAHRIGQWIGRYPIAEAQLGLDFTISDVMDEIYLTAMDHFTNRPADRLGNWLENLVDPAIRALSEHTEAEKENIEMVRETLPAVD